MCTCLLAGKKASADGSVLFAANDDWMGVPGVLTHVPAKDHDEEDYFQLTGGKHLPQVSHTQGYVYTACKYQTGALDRAWAGGMNDCGVAVAGTGVNAYKLIPCEGAWLEPDDVPLLILERAKSARHGIRLIDELIEKYNFQPSTMEGSPSVACFAVADREEAWWLELAPGRHWIAVRVPDDEASVRVNAFGTHDADLTDTENVMTSPNLAEYARVQGWWNGDDRHFDFANVYGHTVSLNEWGPELDDMNMQRRWQAMNLFSGKRTEEKELLYSVCPNRQMDIRDMMAVLRDVYEGTEYDLTKTPAAGRYGDPFHDDPENYSLSHAGTVAGIAASMKSGREAVLWTCMGTPRTSFYIPVYADIEKLPAACECVDPMEESLYWECKSLGFLVSRRFSVNDPMMRQWQETFECSAKSELQMEEMVLATVTDEQESREKRTAFTETWIAAGLKGCREARRELLLKY